MKRCAFSILELLVVIVIIGILIMLLLPAIQSIHAPNSKISCLNQLRQIALASLNYETAHLEFPPATGIKALSESGSGFQLSGMVAILPFIEQEELYDQIVNPIRIDGVDYPACPSLYGVDVPHWKTKILAFTCPGVADSQSEYASIHYGFCIGDRARNIASPNSVRGCFSGSDSVNFGDIVDGSSNSILVAEICSREEGGWRSDFAIEQPATILDDPSSCLGLINGKAPNWQFAKGVQLSSIGRGGHWGDGRAGVALFNTVLPPNSPSVAVDGRIDVDGIYSASGPHPGAVNIALCDGSCHSIDLDIDAGDSSSPTLTEEEIAARVPSPYGVWGALGTINGGEVVDEF